MAGSDAGDSERVSPERSPAVDVARCTSTTAIPWPRARPAGRDAAVWVIGARVDDDGVGEAAHRLHRVDQLTLVIGLTALDLAPRLPRDGGEAAVDVFEGGAAVDRGSRSRGNSGSARAAPDHHHGRMLARDPGRRDGGRCCGCRRARAARARRARGTWRRETRADRRDTARA